MKSFKKCLFVKESEELRRVDFETHMRKFLLSGCYFSSKIPENKAPWYSIERFFFRTYCLPSAHFLAPSCICTNSTNQHTTLISGWKLYTAQISCLLLINYTPVTCIKGIFHNIFTPLFFPLSNEAVLSFLSRGCVVVEWHFVADGPIPSPLKCICNV